jgi:uncharacterized protein
MRGLGAILLLSLASIVSQGSAIAASDVADAAMQRDASRVKQLIRSSANVNTPQPDGTTALHWAAYHGDTATAAALLAARAKADAVSETGMTPLALACEAGNADLVRALLKARADPNQTLKNGETPLMMAARTGSVPVMEPLLARGARIEARENLRGTTPLMWAVANSNVEATRFLIAKGADIRARSAAVSPGRLPYLAPPTRERIQEFIDGVGQGGTVLEDASATPEERAVAKKLLEKEIGIAKQTISKFDTPAEYLRQGSKKWGGLTPLLFAAREGNLQTAKALLDAGASVNETSEFGWTALLIATHNRFYRLGAYLLEKGADPNLANEGGWNPLYLATDNRNIEGGDYPTRKPDMDHLEFIQLLLAAKANPNLRMRSSTETRTVFTHQWLFEEGATPFLRAAQSSDVVLMKMLLAKGADAAIPTDHGITPLMVASGIGWVEGVTYEWSRPANLETVKLLLQLGADANAQERLDGRTALMGAAHKGRNEIVQVLVDGGAQLDTRDIGSRDTIHALAGVTWQAIDYADGLVRVGVQSAIAHPETAALLRKLMKARALPVPDENRTLASICVTDLCK